MSIDKKKNDTEPRQRKEQKLEKTLVIDTLIDLAISNTEYPSYLINEFQGVMVKSFPFIQEITQSYYEPLEQELSSTTKDYSLLAAYKTEVESQLQLQQERCNYFLGEIKGIVKNWIEDQCSSFGEYIYNDDDWPQWQEFALNINRLVHYISIGCCDYEAIMQKKGFEQKPTKISMVSPSGETCTLDLLDLWNKINEPLTVIARTIDKAGPLYQKYLQVYSTISPFDVDNFLKQRIVNQVTKQGKHPSSWDQNLKVDSNDDKLKKIRVRELADEFIFKLRDEEFSTNKEVIEALNVIEPEYQPIDKKEKTLLRPNGKPYEKRICIALANIFAMQNNGESVDWTHVRDIYKEIGISISEI